MLLIIFAGLNGGLAMNVQELRNMFPALRRSVYGKPLVYFDNAATAQRPQSVIDKWTGLTVDANANIHRAVHKLAVDATDEYESTRDAVKEFLNASAREEIVFTSGKHFYFFLLAGATECNNTAIKGVAQFYKDKKNHVITTQTVLLLCIRHE